MSLQVFQIEQLSIFVFFFLLLIANNLYRGVSSYVITGIGLGLEHGVGATLVYFKYFKLSTSGDNVSLQQVAAFFYTLESI
jgi:hypothetical protein